MPRKKTTKNDTAVDQIPGAESSTQSISRESLNAVNQKVAHGAADDFFGQDGELVVDVFETNADFFVTTAIAGVSINDIDISIEGGMMVIKGTRKNPHHNPEKKYLYQECYWGPFSRKIILVENIDIQAAQAQMDKGLLTIKVPKISGSAIASGTVKKESVNLS